MKVITKVEHINDLSLVDQMKNVYNEQFEKFKKFYLPKSVIVWLSRKEVAKRLGISLPTLSKYIDQGKIEAYTIGKNIRIKESDLEKALTKINI